MRYTDRQGRALLAGGAVSVAVHVLAGLALVAGVAMAPPRGVELARAADERDPEELRLGVRRSDAVTMTWLGFETPTPHSAPESVVEQSAMTLAQGTGAEAEPSPAAASDDSARRADAAQNAARMRALLAALQQAAAEREREEAAAIAAEAVVVASAPEEQAEPAEPERAREESARPDAGAAAAAAGDPGLITDRESVAAALKSAAAVVPGRVVATEGLEISTRRPRWSRTTIMTRRPGNAWVWMTFGKDGRVRRAGFVRDSVREYSTGFDDVDEPLLNAVYRWTAKGKPLDRLPDTPEAAVTVRIRVILAG